MQIHELPPSEFVAILKASSLRLLGEVVADASGAKPPLYFRCSVPVIGASRSIRLISPYTIDTFVQHPLWMTPWEVAREFDRLIVEEARFDPPQKPDHEKAVEVRKFLLDGKGVVQIATTWVK